MNALILGCGSPVSGKHSITSRIVQSLKRILRKERVIVVESSDKWDDVVEVLNLLAQYQNVIVIGNIETREGNLGDVYCYRAIDLYDASLALLEHNTSISAAFKLGAKLGVSLPSHITIFAIESGAEHNLTQHHTEKIANAGQLIQDMVTNIIHSKF